MVIPRNHGKSCGRNYQGTLAASLKYTVLMAFCISDAGMHMLVRQDRWKIDAFDSRKHDFLKFKCFNKLCDIIL